MVRLEDDPYTVEDEQSVRLFTRVLNCVRVYNVPAINVAIIAVLSTFLLKLTTKYTELYMKNSLITIIVTNLVLYGISETLAQTLLCFRASDAAVSVRIHDGTRGVLFNSNDISVGTQNTAPYDEDATSDVEEESLDRFLEYLRNPEVPESAGTPGAPVQLTYFQFNRLAGFMCWGFVMAFVQCWWYKFLQIYSKHPQFVEVLRKVMSDQFCFSPVSLFCFFTYGTIVLESGTWEDARAKLRRLYLLTLVINYSVWFPVQFINFLLVPRSFQVPFSSSVAVLWNCFLSMRNSAP